jgi:predicted phosphodiesterase
MRYKKKDEGLETMVRTAVKFIAWPDTHVPYQNRDAVDVAEQISAWYKPDEMVVLGDFIDMAPVSHWNKENIREREGMRLQRDYIAAHDLLKRITKNVKKLTYIEGNHEDWVRQYVDRNPELEGMIEPEVGLKFEELKKTGLKIKHIQYGQVHNIGKLWFTHGTYTGANHAKKHVDAYGRSIVYGHLHDVQMAIKVSPIDVDDKHLGLSLGCLADKNPAYLKNKPNNWVHCIGVGYVRRDGTFNIDPVIISNGVATYAGKTFTSKYKGRKD